MAQRRSTRSRNAQRRLARFFTDRSAERRFGALEYLLLALIGLGIAVTIAMAVIDPSA
jgi:hypothetical protein